MSTAADQGIRYRRYLLGLLLVIFGMSGMDGVALGLLQQNIKTDLGLSDTQVGVLSGFAFALFYSTMGIPIARWADRGNRIAIIAVACLFWGLAVASCGFTASFPQLLLARVCAAAGEAGCVPPAHSLMADYFTRGERPRAVSIYMLGGAVSVLFGYPLAGRLNEAFGWRPTFMVLGLPSLVLAALAWFTLKEPRKTTVAMDRFGRHESSIRISASPQAPRQSFKRACLTLWSNATYCQLLLAAAVFGFCDAGIWRWVPTFFIRSYGMNTTDLGSRYGLILAVAGVIGTFSGGALATRYAAGNERLQLRAIAFMFSLFGVVAATLLLSRNLYLALALVFLATMGVSAVTGPIFATIQTLVPERIRALSIAIVYLFGNLIGVGFGPLAVGMLSDGLRPAYGEESLRYALLALCPAYLWGACHLWQAGKTVGRDLSSTREGGRDVAAHPSIPTETCRG